MSDPFLRGVGDKKGVQGVADVETTMCQYRPAFTTLKQQHVNRTNIDNVNTIMRQGRVGLHQSQPRGGVGGQIMLMWPRNSYFTTDCHCIQSRLCYCPPCM